MKSAMKMSEDLTRQILQWQELGDQSILYQDGSLEDVMFGYWIDASRLNLWIVK